MITLLKVEKTFGKLMLEELPEISKNLREALPTRTPITPKYF